MGHCDEIAIVDANFPAAACAARLVRLDGVDADHSDTITSIERLAFYERAGKAFLIVQTAERRLYGDIILTKGVVWHFAAS